MVPPVLLREITIIRSKISAASWAGATPPLRRPARPSRLSTKVGRTRLHGRKGVGRAFRSVRAGYGCVNLSR